MTPWTGLGSISNLHACSAICHCVCISLFKQNPAGTFSIASLLLVLSLPHHYATCHYSLLPCQFIMMTSYLLYHHNSLIFQETILHWTMVVGGTVSGLSKLHCYIAFIASSPKPSTSSLALNMIPWHMMTTFSPSCNRYPIWGCIITWKTAWFPSRTYPKKVPKQQL